MGRSAGLHRAAVRGLFWLHRHRDRDLTAARLRASRQLQLAVPGDIAHRLLAALAHQSVDLVARLPLHPAQRCGAPTLPGDGADDAPRWPLAWPGLDLCGVWALPWGAHGTHPMDRESDARGTRDPD